MHKIKIIYNGKYLMPNIYFTEEEEEGEYNYFTLKFYDDKFEILNCYGKSVDYYLLEDYKGKLLFSADFSDLNKVIFTTNIDEVEYALTYKHSKLNLKKYKKKYFKRQNFNVINEDTNILSNKDTNIVSNKDINININININFYPLTKKKDRYIEGYWETFTNEDGNDFLFDDDDKKYEKYYKNVEKKFIKNNYKQKYPYPLPSKESLDENFIEKIQDLEDEIQDEKIGETSNQKGPSYCRICNRMLSSQECNFIYKKIKYCFPSGIIHYYEEHNVKPSKEFEEAVMNTKI